MTNHDTELAREIADVFYKATINYPELMNSNWGMNLERAIEQALRSVRQAENEECANVAADHTIATGQYIASAIRNRLKSQGEAKEKGEV